MSRSVRGDPRTAVNARDDFSFSVRKAIAARVGWRCSNPDCQAQTTGPVADPSRASVIGVAPHITAAAQGGPRFDPALSARRACVGKARSFAVDTLSRPGIRPDFSQRREKNECALLRRL